MSVHGKAIAATIIVIFAINYAKSECAEAKPCLCVRPDGMGLSLAALAGIGPLKNDNGSVVFQPCKNANLTFPHSVAPQPPDPSNDCHNTSLCWLNNDNNTINLGTIEETHWHWSEKNPELIISHGSRESHIELICANRGDGPILIGPNSANNLLKFQLSSDKLCITDMRPKALSTGSVLVILFFVFTGLYFIGGAAILIYCRGAVGRETIPNYEFWADLPALVRDGVTFTLSGCSAVSYERI
ncbi:cation-dependent mannose-6-phosphate receptor [Diachasma alloeum]|uniref:cation-dependent mannose-6-phosphate receptor n=1 Tax=Diachasma alloeum TaxID=454923 RepID=UPI000738145B|nr:cation-dependent mannose-6-phosphate receptor [Diachasma alloeum]